MKITNEDVEEWMKERRLEIVTFEMKNFRDVHWCPYLNEPVIVEYRSHGEGEPHDSDKFCVNCHGYFDNDHVFICHVGKP